MSFTRLSRTQGHCLLAVAAVLSLAACSNNDPPDVTVTGTVAKGVALAAATITVICKSGTGTATSNSQGSYTVTVVQGTAPCLLTATSSGITLRSMAVGAGTTLTANISPLTDMLATYLSQVPVTGGATFSSVDSWFANASTQSFLASPSAVAARITTDFLPVVRSLVAIGGGSLALTDSSFLTTPFVVTPTDAQDLALETLLTSNVVAASGAPTSATQVILVVNAKNDAPIPTTTTGSGG